MAKPSILIDLDKIRHNTGLVVSMCRKAGIRVTGVTKACQGSPAVGRAMLAGGVRGLADSRLENLERLRRAGLRCEIMLVRSPAPDEAPDVVRLADVSLNSEASTLEQLSREALRRDKPHGVVLMVDLGDLREGVMPEDLPGLARKTASLSGIRLLGVGTNLACFSGVLPDLENMGELAAIAARLGRLLGRRLPLVSGGNSSALHLIRHGMWDRDVNHLRVGESILLGWDLVDKTPLPDMHGDAFLMKAQVIEVADKPSVPKGRRALNAFGVRSETADLGTRRRAIVKLGRQDVGAGGLRPLRAGARVLGFSSDHTVLDVTECRPFPKVGEWLGFLPDYGSLLGSMTSTYIDKVILNVPDYVRAPNISGLPREGVARGRNRFLGIDTPPAPSHPGGG